MTGKLFPKRIHRVRELPFDGRRHGSAALLLVLSLALGCDTSQFFPTFAEVPAQSVRIVSVRAYQSHEMVLFGPEAEPPVYSTPLLVDKTTLIRIFVEATSAEIPGEITARLRVRTGTESEPVVLEQKKWIFTPSSASALASTFTFILEPGLVLEGTTLQANLNESRLFDAAKENLIVDQPESRWPTSGRARLRPSRAPAMHVRLVPVVFPSLPGIEPLVPAPSDLLLQQMHARLLELYPVHDVEIELVDPLEVEGTIDAYGEGWPDVLDALQQRRILDEPESQVLYYGLLTPTEARQDFCPLTCVQGLTLVTEDPETQFGRAAIGLAWEDTATTSTFLHEIGHTLGRSHSPCGTETTTVDVDYPNEDGVTGRWGWSAVDNKLRPPTDKDLMGYCSPRWISDYQSAGISDRLRAMTLADVDSEEGKFRMPTEVRALHASPFGLRWGATVDEHRLSVAGERRRVQVSATDAREISVPFLPYSHLAGGVYLVPASLSGAADVEIVVDN